MSAGAVILGHAGMSEWADMRSTDYSEGYSARGGQVRNSYNLTQEPGGSSAGCMYSFFLRLDASASLCISMALQLATRFQLIWLLLLLGRKRMVPLYPPPSGRISWASSLLLALRLVLV